MNKFFGFIVWFGAMGLALKYLLVDFLNGMNYCVEPAPLITALLISLVFVQLSAIGRRVFHIRAVDIEKDGLGHCLVTRIFNKRIIGSTLLYTGIYALFFAFNRFAVNDFSKRLLIAVGVFIVCCSVGSTITSRTCARCGYVLVHDDRIYDDDYNITSTSTSIEAYRYSTNYLHCARCRRKVTRRIKHTIAKI